MVNVILTKIIKGSCDKVRVAMYLIDFSSRVSNFIDAADVNGNIKHNSLSLQYLNQIDNACRKAGINNGAVYPIIGGHADSHKYNFLDPRDNDAAFRITWNGTYIHNDLGYSNTGATTDSYGDTHFIPINQMINRDAHMFGYFPSNGGTNNIIIASIRGAGTNQISLLGAMVLDNPSAEDGINNIIPNGNSIKSALISDYEGSFTYLINGNMPNASLFNSGRNTYSNGSIYLGGVNGSGQRCSRAIGFVSLGSGLSSTVAKIFSHEITVAQRSIGRG